MTYTYVINQAAFAAVVECAPRERRLLLEAFNHLAEAPFQEPDMKEMVDGREILVQFIGPFALAYWLDHAVKEIRIMSVFRD